MCVHKEEGWGDVCVCVCICREWQGHKTAIPYSHDIFRTTVCEGGRVEDTLMQMRVSERKYAN